MHVWSTAVSTLFSYRCSLRGLKRPFSGTTRLSVLATRRHKERVAVCWYVVGGWKSVRCQARAMTYHIPTVGCVVGFHRLSAYW